MSIDQPKPVFDIEIALLNQGYRFIGGSDEVGRGCLFGPVCVGLVMLPVTDDLFQLAQILDDVRDSKILSRSVIYDLAEVVKDVAVAWAVGEASAQEIDQVRITGAIGLALQRAYQQIQRDGFGLDYVLGDNLLPIERLPVNGRTVRNGDQICFSIACAAIVAKDYRDRLVRKLAESYDEAYGLQTNVGYASVAHREALRELGPTPHHRRSFRPIAQPRLFDDEGG
jgi:ribonuclease HII